MAGRCVLAGILMLCLCRSVTAQEDESPGALLKRSLSLMKAEKYPEAVTVMYQYLDLVELSDADRVVSIAQDVRFKLATILIKQERLEEAAEVLQKYITTKLCTYPRQARKMLVSCYYELGKPATPGGSPDRESFEKCVDAVLDALDYNANPIVFVEAVAAEKEEEFSQLELTQEVKDPEYTQEELTMLHMTLGEARFGLERWAECVEPFEYVIEHTTDDQRKGYAIMQVINALIEIPDFARIQEWIPQLYSTEARYDIRVNMALMNVAEALYDAEEYDSALPLYRMILPRDEVIAFQRERLRRMRMNKGMRADVNAEISADELALFGNVEEETPEEGEGEGEEQVPKEVRELEALIAALEKLPPYQNNLDYRMAQLYLDVYRFWEAVWFFDKVYTVAPTNDLGQRAIGDVIDVLIDKLNEVDEAKTRAYEYMAQYNEGLTPRRVAYALTGHYYDNKALEDLRTLRPYIDNFLRTNEATIVQFDVELYFMQAVADLMLYDYEASEKGFKRILDEFPESHQEGPALYWYGASKLYLQKYEESWPIFEDYIKRFPEGDWVDEAYFQGGVSLFGMEKYPDASNRFTYVINTYTNSPVYPNACSMRGDLRGAAGDLDEAVADYKNAIAAAKILGNVNQATYATFQMAEIYQAEAEAYDDPEITEAKYDALITAVEDYLDTWGTKADISKALFWIGRIQIQRERYDEAVRTYMNGIIDYGTDVQEDGVDMMIAELSRIASVWLGLDAQNALITDLETALDATTNEVLQLRLQVTIAKLDKTETQLGKRLIRELPDLKSASPPVLAVICDASFEMQDYSRAQEMLNLFVTRFEESDYIRAAYKLRAYGQYDEGDFEGALKTIEEAQGTFGHDRDVVWAQLMKAMILFDKGMLDEAREANMYVKNIPGWRGEPVAQATYQLGLVEEKAGNNKTAFGHFQRVFVQYQAYDDGRWAAESYLAGARCLKALGLEKELKDLYRDMLYSPYMNKLPQAEEARKALGAGEVAQIESFLDAGGVTNIAIQVDVGKMVDTTLMNMDSAEPDSGGDAVDTDVNESSGAETDNAETAETGGES